MRLLTCILLFSALCANALTIGGFASNLGDARFSGEREFVITNMPSPGMVEVTLPPGEYKELTFLTWVAVTETTPPVLYKQMSASLFYCPEPVDRTGDDILEDACAYTSETNLNGQISFPALTFAAYPAIPTSPTMTYGAYTVAGWSSNVVTVVMGGITTDFGPGDINRNITPAASSGLTVTSTGLCSLGISRCHLHQFFGGLGNVSEEQGIIGVFSLTNELRMVVFRLKLDGTNHTQDVSMYDAAGLTNGVVATVNHAFPDNTTTFSSRGIYRFGVAGVGVLAYETINYFGYRFYPWSLSDYEIERVLINARQEIIRRPVDIYISTGNNEP